MKSARLKIIVPCLALVGVVWFFRGPIENHIRLTATLNNTAPEPEGVSEMIARAADPHAALMAAWNSGKIVQREVALQELRNRLHNDEPLPADVNALLLSGAFDPDMNIREAVFGLLQSRHHPALLALAAGQLHDVDPAVRLLGLLQFKLAPAAAGVPVVASLLDDPDLSVVSISVKYLETWSGEKFGVKLSDAVPVENQTNGLLELPAPGVANIKAAMAKAKAWWSQHQNEYPPVKLELPAEAMMRPQPLSAGNFQARTLDGQPVKLADYRGKVVLLNFWTTWCTACATEIPELVALQKKHVHDLGIIGVSLDFVPDDDGSLGGDEGGQKLPAGSGKAAALAAIRAKVVRLVAARNISYPVILDETDAIGGQFNGGELPTTVIVDANGNVRRRFIGARSLEVFEAMIQDAAQNPSARATTQDPHLALTR